MNRQQNELFESSVKSLSNAMGLLKFDGTLTAKDADEIQDLLAKARGGISTLSDVNTDGGGQFKVLIEMTALLEKSLDAVNPSSTFI